MLRKAFVIVFVAALAAAFTFGAAGKTDPVSGDWHVVFSIAGQTAEGTMKLKLDGNKITGTVETAHTGPGTLSNGKWADGKMSFTAEFPKHESIDITGVPKDGKLSGDFKTEGMAGTWLGTKE